MPINFNQQETKKSKFPIAMVLLVLLLIVASFATWFFLIKKPQIEEVQNSVATTNTWKKIEINFDILNDPVFKSLQDFQKAPEFNGKIGRSNPFK